VADDPASTGERFAVQRSITPLFSTIIPIPKVSWVRFRGAHISGKKFTGCEVTLAFVAACVMEADGIALANLCQAYSTMLKAQEQLNKAGILYKDEERLCPAVAVARHRQ
jgi:hypothetical protein